MVMFHLRRVSQFYERGDKLRAHCNKLLTSAEKKVEKIRLSSNGTPESVEELHDDNE